LNLAVPLSQPVDNFVSVESQIESAIAKKFAEEKERGKNVKMTWTTRTEAWNRVGGPGRRSRPVGTEGMDIGLPGMWFEKLYFLQNSRLFLSNGHEISIKDVPDRARAGHSCAVCELRQEFADDAVPVFKPCTLRELIVRMMVALNATAEAYDPNLCKHCHKFSSDNGEETAMHLFTEHPEILMGKLPKPAAVSPTAASSGVVSSSVAPGPVASTPPVPVAADPPGYTVTRTAPVPVSTVTPPRTYTKEERSPDKRYYCDKCPRKLPTERGLQIHQARLHKT
jgi:hypothetical protein